MKLRNHFLLLFILFLTACGFHLRGQYEIPEGLQFVVLQGEVSEQLKEALKNEFNSVGITDSKNVDNIPRAYLNLSDEVFDKNINTLAVSGQVSNYDLDYSVIFSVSSNDELKKLGKAVAITEQKVKIHRVLNVDQQAVLASKDEERTIRQEMYAELARMILFRIQTLTKTKTP